MSATPLKKKRKYRVGRILLAVTALLALAVWLLTQNLTRVVLSLAYARARSAAVMSLNGTAHDLLESGVTYDQLMHVEKDAQGRVTLLQANTAMMNELSAQAVSGAQQALSALESQVVEVPVGAALGGAILAGWGPKISVAILPVGSASAAFSTEFVSAGINQTRHRILLTLAATVRLVLPTGANTFEVTAQSVLAETIIVGDVPDSFVDVNNDADMLNLIP